MVTLKEVKVEKKILEDMIGKLITDFEITYGIRVDNIRIDERIESMVGNDTVFIKVDVTL